MTVMYNQQAWLKERTLIHVSGVQSGNRVKLVEVDAEVLTSPVIYTPASDGNLVIDVTDIIRIYGLSASVEFNVAEINASGQQVGTAQSVDISVAGDTNPDNWVIPTHPIKEWADNDILIGLPRMILKPILGIKPIFPILADLDISGVYLFYNLSTLITVNGGWNLLNPRSDLNNIAIRVLTGGAYRLIYTQELIEATDCQKQAVVEWRDRLGMTKRAVWELRNVTENTADEQEIDNISNAYDVRKGKEITSVLHLEGLTAFDVWYYSDIVTSSDVRVALKASDYDSTADKIKDECKVEVTTKKAEIPDGDSGEFYSLDIEINYKRYDTV